MYELCKPYYVFLEVIIKFEEILIIKYTEASYYILRTILGFLRLLISTLRVDPLDLNR